MYSEKVSQNLVEKLESLTKGLKLVRHTEFDVLMWKKRLGETRRPLTPEEQIFVRNEILVSMCDFRYWAPRYCTIDYDGTAGGGVGLFKFWDAQLIVLDKIAKAQEEAYDCHLKHEPTDGVRIVDHKSKQLGGTALSRAITMHRMTLHPNQRGLGASIDEDKVQELYDRDKQIYDKLPWWIKPSLDSKSGGYDVKGEHIRFESLNSRLIYQDSRQRSGMGQGRHFEVVHVTELSGFESPEVDIVLHLFPALAQHWQTIAILESQALGRGNWWHEFSEKARKGREIGWIYVFVPWYAERKKYRRHPPPLWEPTTQSLAHAKRVYETSQEFVGHKVMLDREQLYWYETTRASYVEGDKLNFFLTCYAATPEESFQHTTQSAFSAAVLEQMDHCIMAGQAYELDTCAV